MQKEWQPGKYPILYIDAIHYSVRDNGVIRKLAAYVILGINTGGVKDILIICADGLSGIKEAIAAVLYIR